MKNHPPPASPPVPPVFSAVFDMDGVIVDNRDFHFRAWERFAREHGLPFDPEYFKNNLFGRVNREILKGLFKADLPPEEAARYAQEKEALYRELYKGHVRPAAGLVDLLEELKAAGITTAVATSAPRINLAFVLEEADLRPFFDVLVDIGAVLKGKPEPDLYLRAAEELRRRPEECVAFEDSYPGVASALAAGMRVVGVTTTHTAAELGRVRLAIADFRGVSVEKLRALFIEPPPGWIE
jgi:beta-phosphoglucomutase family hydrolase